MSPSREALPLPLALVNLQSAVDWIEHWWTDLDDGDRGTWVGGLATAVAVIVTLIIAFVTRRQQRQQALDLQNEKQELQKENKTLIGRSHAEKFSCWVAGRLNSPVTGLPIPSGGLIVALINS